MTSQKTECRSRKLSGCGIQFFGKSSLGISLGMFAANPFRSWDHWDKNIFLQSNRKRSRHPWQAPRLAGARWGLRQLAKAQTGPPTRISRTFFENQQVKPQSFVIILENCPPDHNPL